MTPLEALEALARDARGSDYADEREQSEWFGIVDDALAALSPRVVTTAEELDTLPEDTLVMDGWMQDRDAWRKIGGGWVSTSSYDSGIYDSVHLADMGPVTVVWTPQQDPNPTPLGH